MHILIYTLYMFMFLTTCFSGFCQETEKLGDSIPPSVPILDLNPRVIRIKGTTWVYSGICKVLKETKLDKKSGFRAGFKRNAIRKRSPLATIHGSIQYDYYYRSRIDTPFLQQDLSQHSERVILDITTRRGLPWRLDISSRQSNSPFLRNFFDLGLHFDEQNYQSKLKQLLYQELIDRLQRESGIREMEETLKHLITEYEHLKEAKNGIRSPRQLIEERERIYFQLKPDTEIEWLKRIQSIGQKQRVSDDLDSKQQSAALEMEAIREEAFQTREGLKEKFTKINQLKNRIDSVRLMVVRKSSEIRERINKATSASQLRSMAAAQGIEIESSDKSIFKNIRSLDLGRSVVNYTELTAWNMTLTGLQVEHMKSAYLAFAAGKIDYGFRDFFGNNFSRSGQNMVMARFGLGNPERKAVIASVFTGKKFNYNGPGADTLQRHIGVLGYSIEALFRKDELNGFSVEFAKSIYPATGSNIRKQQLGKLWAFEDGTNGGINLKGNARIQVTKTRLSGFYRKTGANYQAFNLFTNNSDQLSWQLKAHQPFLKEKVNLTAMLRRNDFTNPLTDKTFKTSTVFTSLLFQMSIPRWPSVTIGYYPGTQFFVVDSGLIRENAYYIFNSAILYGYKVNNLRMSSSIIYNRYFNKATDSVFVLSQGVNYLISHSVFFTGFDWQVSYAFTDQEELSFYTLESSTHVNASNKIQIGAGLRYNRVDEAGAYAGGFLQFRILISKIGNIQIQFDKSHLPTLSRKLYPVEVGRVSWFKTF